MDVMNSPEKHITKLLADIQEVIPDITLKPSESFYWSPQQKTIAYKENSLNKPEGLWSLLHETAHAQLDHHIYKTDFELLMLEVAAWKQAKTLAHELKTTIDENYLQDCLDTYRDWLHRRSTCPTCGNVGLQHSSSEYRCHNCHTSWHVTAARFCRPYRKKQITIKEKSPDSPKNQTTFR